MVYVDCLSCGKWFESPSETLYCNECKQLGKGKKRIQRKPKKDKSKVLGYTKIPENKKTQYKGRWNF